MKGRALIPLVVLAAASPAAGEERPSPDFAAIEEAVSRAPRPVDRYVSARAVSHYLAARMALEEGDTARAEEELALASLYDTQSAWPKYVQALERSRRGDTKEAEALLREALQIDAEHAPSLRLWGRLTLERGLTKRAIELLVRAAGADPSHPEPFALLARAWLARGDLTSAVAVTERLDALAAEATGGVAGRAVALAAESLSRVADALAGRGRDEEAERLYRRSIEREPWAVRRLDALVDFLKSRGRSLEAAGLAARSISVGGREPGRILSVARLYLEAGEPARAAAYVELLAALDEGPGRDEALVSLGSALLSVGSAEPAARAFRAALDIAPERVDARWFLGVALETDRQWEPALAAYRTVPEDDRFGVAARARAALCEQRLGRGEQAIEALRRLLDEAPSSLEVPLVLAQVLEAERRIDEAREVLETRLERGASRRVTLQLADLLRRSGRASEAVVLLDLHASATPDEAWSWALVQALGTAGHVSRLVEEARSLLKRWPSRSDVANHVAWLLAEEGRALDEAEALARRALAVETDRWEYLDTLGWVLVKQGRPLEALDALGKAHERAPDDLDVTLHLVEALEQAGRAQDALALARQAAAVQREPAEHERVARAVERLATRVGQTAAAEK